MTTYTMTTFHWTPLAGTCTQCKKGIQHGETVNDINGELYHETCWNRKVRTYATNNIIEPKAGEHCSCCGYDLNRKGIETVLDGDQVKCFDCVVGEGLANGKTTI